MRATTLLCTIAITISLICCDSGVELEPLPIDNLFSVSSFISPQDTVLTAYLYKARPLGSFSHPDSALVKNALVIIYDDLNRDTLFFSNTLKRYETKKQTLVIEPSKTYFLKVTTPSGAFLNASCIIPPTPALPELSGVQEDNDFSFTVKWDNPTDHKYFTLLTYAEGTYSFEYPFGTQTQQLKARLVDNYLIFPSDQQKNSNVFYGILPYAYDATDPKLSVTIRNVEQTMFQYFEDYRKYEEWDANNSGNLFPSFQEPKPIFTNIEGGVGIFSGYNQSTVKFEF